MAHIFFKKIIRKIFQPNWAEFGSSWLRLFQLWLTVNNFREKGEDGVLGLPVHFRPIGEHEVFEARDGRFGQLIVVLLYAPSESLTTLFNWGQIQYTQIASECLRHICKQRYRTKYLMQMSKKSLFCELNFMTFSPWLLGSLLGTDSVGNFLEASEKYVLLI